MLLSDQNRKIIAMLLAVSAIAGCDIAENEDCNLMIKVNNEYFIPDKIMLDYNDIGIPLQNPDIFIHPKDEGFFISTNSRDRNIATSRILNDTLYITPVSDGETDIFLFAYQTDYCADRGEIIFKVEVDA